MTKVLIIQTAFIGDVILSTSLIETIKKAHGNNWVLDVLVRKGNESLLLDNPLINEVLIWNKSENKYKNLLKIAKNVRANQYDKVFNLQRFAASGFITWRSNAKVKVGYAKNPFAFTFNYKIAHQIGDGSHEIDRNLKLLNIEPEHNFEKAENPKLYPSLSDQKKVEQIVENKNTFYVLAPASVWFTKQLPEEKWIELGKGLLDKKCHIYFVGAPSDTDLIARIIKGISDESERLINLAGKLSLMESAVLISKAEKTFVNDSAPLHIASAMNAPVVAFFCSTVPKFGFGPLSKTQEIIEVHEDLSCRPCGLHGYAKCPEGHFKCGKNIDINSIKY